MRIVGPLFISHLSQRTAVFCVGVGSLTKKKAHSLELQEKIRKTVRMSRNDQQKHRELAKKGPGSSNPLPDPH